MSYGSLVMIKPVFITGFMSTGKSTVAPIVANKLGWRWIDTDRLIEKRMRQTITQIFSRHGEAYFRVVEQGVMYELAAREQIIVSTGGGALIDEATYHAVAASCCVACLHVEKDVIRKRLTSPRSRRPLAPHWEELFDQRRDAYARIRYQIEPGRTPQETANRIIAACKNR